MSNFVCMFPQTSILTFGCVLRCFNVVVHMLCMRNTLHKRTILCYWDIHDIHTYTSVCTYVVGIHSLSSFHTVCIRTYVSLV